MLTHGSNLHNTPVMSLQTGTALAVTGKPIIDPDRLRVVAYELEGPLLVERPAFLRVDEIRELGSVGIIIDSSDELIGLHDVITLERLYELGFNLVGLSVIDEEGRKLGKVADYSVDTLDFVIKQLQVNRGLLKSLANTALLINRSQIVTVTDTKVIVKSMAHKEAQPVLEAIRHDYVNPFRTQKPRAEAVDTNRP